LLKQHKHKVPLVVVVEPDSLSNLAATSSGGGVSPNCGSLATSTGYQLGVKYAVETLKSACGSSCGVYLDAAHGGWLGGQQTRLDSFVQIVANLGLVLPSTEPPAAPASNKNNNNNNKHAGSATASPTQEQLLRGFTLNVGNYQPLGSSMCSTSEAVRACDDGSSGEEVEVDGSCCAGSDACGLGSELNYARVLTDAFKAAVSGFDPKVVIDTGRNGVGVGLREDCGSWCNVRGAGVGALPTTNTVAPEVVDAYYWLKMPGESDGCTAILPDSDGGGTCPRFDDGCASEDSIGSRVGEPRAPEAGVWFDYAAKMLASNANAGWETS